MDIDAKNIVFRKSTVFWVALVTLALLLIPFVAMQFTDQVNWNVFDFVVMGLLLSSMGSISIFVISKASRKHRIVIGILLTMFTLYIWSELAVGVFTDLGT